jgi:hypothetical protein
MGVRLKDHTYLFVPKDVTWHEAKYIGERLGGHLVTIASLEQLNLLCSMVPYCKGPRSYGDEGNDYKFYPWIGLETVQGKVQWVTREPVSYATVLHWGTHGWLWDESRRGVLDFANRYAIASAADDHRPFFIQWDD